MPSSINNGRPLALVTGASSGIGAAFARRLATDGYDLILSGRRLALLQALAIDLGELHGGLVEIVAADLRQEEAIRRLEQCITETERLELLVNNAGFALPGAFSQLDIDGQEGMIRVHVIAPVRLTRAALPQMIARKRGAIINVSSLAAFFEAGGNVTYLATKAYLNKFTEAMNIELKGSGLRWQALCPGFTHSDFHHRPGVGYPRIPSWLWSSAEEVVAASLQGLRKGKVICIPGRINRALALIPQLVPHFFLYYMERQLLGRMRKSKFFF